MEQGQIRIRLLVLDCWILKANPLNEIGSAFSSDEPSAPLLKPQATIDPGPYLLPLLFPTAQTHFLEKSLPSFPYFYIIYRKFITRLPIRVVELHVFGIVLQSLPQQIADARKQDLPSCGINGLSSTILI